MTDVRATSQHDYANYIQGIQNFPAKLKVETKSEDAGWTKQYLSDFAQPEAEYYIDHEYPGWLVWGKTMPAYKSNVKNDIEYDELEWSKRVTIGKLMDRQWFKTIFKYLKQEPRDSNADRFRAASAMMLTFAFELIIRDNLAAATFDEIKDETLAVFGDGSDKHQHRATSEILAGMIGAVMDTSIERRTMVWEFAFPIIQKVFSDGLTPENSGYWTGFLRMILQTRDPQTRLAISGVAKQLPSRHGIKCGFQGELQNSHAPLRHYGCWLALPDGEAHSRKLFSTSGPSL